MTARMKRYAVLFFINLLTFSLIAQSYQFYNYGLSDGLCDIFAYTINQDQKGFLWIGTDQGLCRFDGRGFDQNFKGDSIPKSIPFTSLVDSRGRLWFGYENGTLSVLEDDAFRLIDPGEEFRSPIQAIREDTDGNMLVMSQKNGIFVINPALEITYIGDPNDPSDPFTGKFYNDFQITTDGNLLVGASESLSLYRFDSDLESFIHTGDFPDLQYMLVKEIAIAINENEYWVGTEDEGLFRVTGIGYNPEAYEVEKIGEEQGLGYARISSIVFNGRRKVWITDYGVGIHRIELDESGNLGSSVLFDSKSGIPNEYIYEVFIDEEGNQWFSSQGNGIAVLRDQAFTYYNIWDEEDYYDVNSLYIKEKDYWFGGDNRIAHFNGDSPREVTFLGPENGLPNDIVSALYVDRNNDLYIGTKQSGMFVKRDGSSRITPSFVSRNSLDNIINAIDGHADSIIVATNNGVYTLQPSTGRRTSFSTLNGLPHNKINDVLVDRSGVAWIATETRGLISLNTNKRYLIDGNPLDFRTLVEDDNGVLWAGTFGDGVFRFTEDTLKYYNEISGLKSNYTYSIGIDPNGYIWVGHRFGLSRIHPENEMIRTFGREQGFDSDIRENTIANDVYGKMFLGSSGGVIQYDAFQAKEDTIPPKLSIKSVVISDIPYDPSEDIKLKYGKYRIRIDFVGINLSNPEQVTYQFRLDGDEDEWRDFSYETYAYYGAVEDGNYNFMLRACDANGNCSPVPLKLSITVKIPIWKAWWFIAALVLLALTAIFVIFKIRERNQKAIQEYLQRQLDERTREVVMQKDEIEIKNRDITDSINYAQRIQASILPPIKKLHDAFTGSFVFYQPRDIVSGDFYWYEKTGDNKFMVVCADSTGHGVPGAFMSMIGTTMIKDICLRAGIQKPSQVLTTLDNEVREALNQNVEATGSNDGMDIIVAEIDMSTFNFRVSSAMRPVIIYSGGEQIYVKGSRSSIGGQLDEDMLEKEFIDHEFRLKKGDIIYMFSDGYPDQFGGPLGRKFKMVRLKNLLRDIHDKPMEEQYNYIKSNFFLWKEDLEQVDDVLFMGIKL